VAVDQGRDPLRENDIDQNCATTAHQTHLLPQTTQCSSPDLSLSRPSYFQRVNSDANTANQALGTGVVKLGTFLGTGALSNDIFGTSSITPFQTYLTGAESVSTNFGAISGLTRVGAAIGVRLVAGVAVYGAWRIGNYAGAAIGNISLPSGPTITDGVSAFIDFEANGPSGIEPSTCRSTSPAASH
jgi:hypothetical protein